MAGSMAPGSVWMMRGWVASIPATEIYSLVWTYLESHSGTADTGRHEKFVNQALVSKTASTRFSMRCRHKYRVGRHLSCWHSCHTLACCPWLILEHRQQHYQSTWSSPQVGYWRRAMIRQYHWLFPDYLQVNWRKRDGRCEIQKFRAPLSSCPRGKWRYASWTVV